MDKAISYGILAYNSINIGDEIQSIAASRFVPNVDEFVYREQISDFVPKSGNITKCILNAWWMWRPEKFPPSKYIDPLLTSLYIKPAIRKKFLTGEVRKFFLEHGPVGCRDVGTYEWLKRENIPAYFSGCLTLTLQRNYKIPRQDYILCVDVPDECIQYIKTKTSRPVYSISRMLSPYYSSAQRLRLAKIILRLYHDAALVVSPRLHVILPSLAMETPVLRLIANEEICGEISRYSGYETFLNSVDITKSIDDLGNYDFDNPADNPHNHLEVRKNLIKKCSDFTGFDNPESLIDENINPIIELLQLNEYSNKQIKRIAFWLSPWKLFRIFLRRLFCVDRFAIKDSDFKL